MLFLLMLWPGARLLTGVSLERLPPDKQVAAVDAARSRLLQLGAGVLAAAALIFTARGFYLQREAQMTDRYIRAVEQLGSASLEVRMGAI
ncbi:hypothetical protein ETD83_08455 [Actinomadura soli]|uniref:Uncharacterized protein n=1 Tax=Actinomadura soli TaxID=2508997 RepID=A0A5C4JG81_9ACTN|nr:hypothetical protein [Actinomadura soli]TMR04377.1 hypothetical protein ETD83_08455 [Actinomadura soli]